jgi:tetratricopeptide (TPR) repeat protein
VAESGKIEFDPPNLPWDTASAVLMLHRLAVRWKRGGLAGGFSICWVLVTAVASAQVGRDPFNAPDASTTQQQVYRTQGSVLLLTVFAESEKVRLDRQSVVKLHNQSIQTVTWQTTNDVSEAAFGDLPFGKYDVEVSAVGYLTEHKELQIISALNTLRVEMVLHRDPAALELAVADSAMPPKARKQAKHGVSALKSGNLNEANKRLDAAYKLAPSNPDLNFLLGYLFYEKRDFGRAQSFLGTATSLNPNDVQALTLLGRLGLQQEDYGRATSTLEKAVAADSEYWVAHDLLADSYLRQGRYEKARDQARLAIEKGRSGVGSAQLILGQALVNLGQKQEGIQALKTFMQDSPKNPGVPQVRNLVTQLEARDSGFSGVPETATTRLPSLTAVDPLIAAAEPTFSIRPWQPLGIDETKLPVAAGLTCPYENVIDMSGARVKQLVDDVSRIAAIEHLVHERVDEIGNLVTKETRDFNYVASISENQPGLLEIDEYRTEHLGLSDFPDHIASSGFAALALVFHPDMRDNFEMTCEGLGDWHGQAAWLVHFRQRDDRPARIHDYKVGGEIYSLKLKGRAWITADKFQIVRIESELVSPVPRIRLVSEHQIVEYGPVPFQKKTTELWLPKSAEIYFDFRRHRYFRRHSFDRYMLFSTESEEKRKEPTPASTLSSPQPN